MPKRFIIYLIFSDTELLDCLFVTAKQIQACWRHGEINRGNVNDMLNERIIGTFIRADDVLVEFKPGVFIRGIAEAVA